MSWQIKKRKQNKKKEKEKGKPTATKKTVQTKKKMRNKCQKKVACFYFKEMLLFFSIRLAHELVVQHVQKNRIYSLFVLHIVHNEMDYLVNNVIVYVYNTLQNL